MVRISRQSRPRGGSWAGRAEFHFLATGAARTPRSISIVCLWLAIGVVLEAPTALAALLGTATVVGCGSSTPGTIGAGLGQKADHRLFIRSLPPGEGAERAGLMLDDEILLIDGKEVRTMSQDDVRRAVRGDVGTTLTLTILRQGETRTVKVVRTPLVAGAR